MKNNLYFSNVKFRIFVSVICTSTLLTGCLTSQREEQLQSSIRNLELKINELEKGLVQRDKSLDSVKTNSEDAKRNTQAAKTESEDIKRQISLTQGAVDELRIKVSRLQEVSGKGESDSDNMKLNDLSEQTATIDRRVAKLELQLQNKLEVKSESEGSAVKSPLGKFKNPEELSKYLAGLFAKKEYKKVVQTSTNVLESKSSNAMDEVALEFRAESHFKAAEYEKAAVDYSEYLTRFPKSDRRARALLLGGDSYIYLSQVSTAKGMYEECFKKFPNKEECKAARERFEKL